IKGVVKEMAFFFKSPMDTNVINTHQQYENLISWFQGNL
ncbi:MAG TPA: inositol-3-phosphate synthase, partial [Thermoplasmatales archaeon]|nr:inositol-3-phosphate synthase [Thermoplasmatales archaeon]